jgi:uncharacterized damage-inducible protein DinB
LGKPGFSFVLQKIKIIMKENLLSLLENSRGYTMAIAEAMPVNLDNFKPAADVWSFREQLHHIAYGIEWWKDNYVKRVKTSWEPPATSKSRKEAVSYLDHITHHRGQAIIYLRCNGIAAPEYTF